MTGDSAAAKKDFRNLARSKIAIPAQVFDPDSNAEYHGMILNASRDGCRLFCDSLLELPDEILVQPDGIAKPIKASIKWRKGITAGLALNWGEKSS